ncbi:ABC transporter permease [Pleionea sp. CnH1-48]|uniref:ABC transporter permease n=1 Tax=Pleionea sp. CnH1-48 TaxID=2954494 RepID=UPI0020983C61|nr:ABC transporter permease [Pleionea sp. CnH1-48]MCO7226512.1 ABC transporter permease [Pleionea sp. CnH1-48]
MLADLMYTLRSMSRNLKFSLLTVFVMTTGLALFIFIYSFLHNTLTSPLPFAGGDRVRLIQGMQVDYFLVRMNDYEEMKSKLSSFDTFDAYSNGTRNLMTSDRSMRENTYYVSPTFFEVSDAKPLLGRLLNEKDLEPAAEPVAIIGESLWQRLYASDADILGKKLRVNNVPHTIVGVMPQAYRFPQTGNLWLPFKQSTAGVARASAPFVKILARTKPGITDEKAQAELTQMMSDIEQRFPKLNADKTVNMITYQEAASQNQEELILAMKLCVALVMLLACINTGNLLLSRALEKNKESAIRSALGAPRLKLVVQVMLESAIICLASGIFACMIAAWGLDISLTELSKMFRGSEAPFWWQFDLTSSSFIVAGIVTLVLAVVTGALPALMSTGGDINSVLRDGTRGAQSKVSSYLSQLIVVIEVALSCALLILATSMVLTVYNKSKMDFGVEFDGYLSARITLPRSEYNSDSKIMNYFRSVEQELESNPNVEAVSYTRNLPFTWTLTPEFMMEGADYGKDPQYPLVEYVTVARDYFETMGVKLLEGRAFDARDKAGSPLAAVVTQSFINRYSKDESPIGKRFKLVGGDDQWFTIVGVVNSVAHVFPYGDTITRPSVFVSLEQNPGSTMNIVIKAKGDPNLVRESLSQVTFKAEPNAPLFNVRTVARLKERAFADYNFISGIFVIFAIASTVLAFSGIYGVVANMMVQKTQEVGIRKALGADDAQVLIHFLIKNGKLLLAGLVIGIPIGYVLINMLEDTDLVTMSVGIFVMIPLGITLISLLAVISPVGRTLKMEPILALRYE